MTYTTTSDSAGPILVATPGADLIPGIQQVTANLRGPLTTRDEWWRTPGDLSSFAQYIRGGTLQQSLLWDPATSPSPSYALGKARPTVVNYSLNPNTPSGSVDYALTQLRLQDAHDILQESRWVFKAATAEYAMPPQGSMDAASAPLLSDWFYGTPDRLVLARLGESHAWRIGTSSSPTADAASVPMVSIPAPLKFATYCEPWASSPRNTRRAHILRQRWRFGETITEGTPALDLSTHDPHRLVHPGLSTALYGLPPAVEYCGAVVLRTDSTSSTAPPAPSVVIECSLAQTLAGGTTAASVVDSAAATLDDNGDGFTTATVVFIGGVPTYRYYYVYRLQPTSGSIGMLDATAYRFVYSADAVVTGSYGTMFDKRLRVWHRDPPWHPQLHYPGDQARGVDDYPGLMVDLDG